MQSFNYKRLSRVEEALGNGARFLGGGTTLLDLMKLEVETPGAIADVSRLPLAKIEKTQAGGYFIGAAVRNADLANDENIKKNYSVLSTAILSGASAQIRNKATTAGNLLQRTRCLYFRDITKPCNKRAPGSGCPAIQGANRNLAILGTSNTCIATNPSDMNVALAALEAKIHLRSTQGERVVNIADFHLLPGLTPEKETVVQPGELITGVTLPAMPSGAKSSYLKLRDRASYEFALASTAVVAVVRGGKFERVRIAMGGIGTKPWRSTEAEAALENGPVSETRIRTAVEIFLKGAQPQTQNGFKIELAQRCLTYSLTEIAKA